MGVLALILKISISVSLFFSQAPFCDNLSINSNTNSNISSLNIYTTISSSDLENISAKKLAVVSENGINYYEKNSEEPQSIASITKLMTALVFFDKEIDLNDTYLISGDDAIDGGKRHFFPGEEIKLKDILFAALIASDNEAASILSKIGEGDDLDFVNLMNEKARELNMVNSSFSDPTGLNKDNISSASEVAILFKEAWKNEIIKEALSTPEYSFKTLQGREKKIISTDYSLLEDDTDSSLYMGGKTGYIDEAGYCFVGNFNINNNELVVVVLNSDSKNSRFKESLCIAKILKEKYFN